jgi:hypothetical protein
MMNSFGASLFVLLGVLFGSASAHAVEAKLTADCLDKSRVEVLTKEFNIVTKGEATFNRCDPSTRTYRLLQALMYLQDLKLEAFRTSEFNNNFIDERPFDFFKARTRNIVVEPQGGCRKGYIAYVQMGEETQGLIHICDISNQSVFQISSTLLHEVRHLDPKDYAHIGCTHGMLMGSSGACDARYEDGGSYAIGAEFYVKLARSKNVDPVIRQEARASAVSVFQNSFNQYPLGLKQGALLKATDGRFAFYDGDALRKFPMEAAPHSLMVARIRVPTLFNRDDSSVKSYNFGARMVDTKGVFADEFRNRMSYTQQKSLVDIAYGVNYDCKLFVRSIVCETENGKTEKMLPDYKGMGLVSSKWTVSLQKGTLYLSADNGYLYALPDKFEDFQKMAPKDWKRSPGIYHTKEVAFWDINTDIVLTNDGKIRFYIKESKSWETSKMLTPYTFESMIAPYIWSEKLEDL